MKYLLALTTAAVIGLDGIAAGSGHHQHEALVYVPLAGQSAKSREHRLVRMVRICFTEINPIARAPLHAGQDQTQAQGSASAGRAL